MLDVVVLGISDDPVPYLEGWELQRQIHADVVNGSRPDTLLLLQHESVYTAGKRTEHSERPVDGTPVIDVDRGGKITWHGPGQLVGYPITRLAQPIDVVGYVRTIENLLIDVLAKFSVSGQQVEGRSGVWVQQGSGCDKLAAIGIRVSEGVTMHGFALNCNNTLDAYDNIVACGIRDAGATTISHLTGRNVTPADAIPVVTRIFQHHFEESHVS
ncbi:lipoyl(octanoyl) transferase LipB [Alpinimonas psychrophila]|uniref:Octanoyltransferase n=1 Tax=Alpinimonas psychrophila TaxID=748908 RepID=A0A7W3JT22_9MICO|nr:lipoyl(octanoyl) transferase LipB [Alpinimonas psychrophila]MBA8828577.1 lipoyl(octanoyl) transferase [Alpinimonas psychrophila]